MKKPKMASPGSAPVLIALPHGLNVSGVTMWGVRLANALAESGRVVGLLTHDEPDGHNRLEIPISPQVRTWNLAGAPPMDKCNGDLSAFMPTYLCAIESLADAAGEPVIFSPNLVGDCYGLAAAIACSRPGLIRVVAWQHNDTEYDSHVLGHYEPLIGAYVGVSEFITNRLRARMPTRAQSIHNIPYGVEVPRSAPLREPLSGRPIRLIYTGRMEHFQKRVGVIPEISRALDTMGVPHELTMLGDGPAAHEIDARIEKLTHCTRLPGAGPVKVRKRLAEADIFLLTSRFEGLSVAMLEALAAGCVPLVARVESGAGEAIRAGHNGLLIDAGEDDESRIAKVFAHRISELVEDPETLEDMSRNAWETARDRYAIEAHADHVGRVFDALQDAPARHWPADRPAGFTSSSSVLSDATVPTDAALRLRRVLQEIESERNGKACVALWGAGRHTIALAAELAVSPVEITAILDNDPSAQGKSLWRIPVVGLGELKTHQITDVVISSWMHQQAMWQRRDAIEQLGIRTHRLYPGVGVERLPMRPAGHDASAVA
jgi:glycosyltransferase involved in cell wall biosynthesis